MERKKLVLDEFVVVSEEFEMTASLWAS